MFQDMLIFASGLAQTAVAAVPTEGDHGSLIVSFALIGLLGIGAQWIAWRANLPAIVLMAVAGLIVGPGLQILNPEADFGEFYRPMIAVAVAVILFEGGLTLKFDEIKGVQKGLSRYVIPAVPFAWLFGALATHFVAGLSWPAAILFAGIMIVTGPTVIMPLLRQSKLNQRTSKLLKWEGIINDPLGGLLAVVVYEYVTYQEHGLNTIQVTGSLFLGSLLSVAIGVGIGYGVAESFKRGWVPEYLKPPVLLVFVLIAFVVANLIQEEAGLLSVTAMGIMMANAKLPSINQLRHFKENIAILFVSGVFVMLTANLDREILAAAFNLRTLAFVLVMMIIVRPASIMLATIGTDLSMNERILTAWIAPRGVVAVAVTGLFAGLLTDAGIVDGEQMIPLAFAMVFITVVVHGFTIKPLGRMLGLASKAKPGFLLVGASPWAVALAKKLQEMKFDVLIADDSYRSLRSARQSNIPTYYGEILSEVTEHHIDLNRYGFLFAVGGNEAHNALVCTDLAPEMDRSKIYQLSARGKEESDRKAVSYSLQGKTLLNTGTGLEELLRRHYAGWTFTLTRLSEEFPPEKYLAEIDPSAELVLLQRKDQVQVSSAEVMLKPEIGDLLLAYTPLEDKAAKAAKEARDAAPVSEAVKDIEEKKKEALEKM